MRIESGVVGIGSGLTVVSPLKKNYTNYVVT